MLYNFTMLSIYLKYIKGFFTISVIVLLLLSNNKKKSLEIELLKAKETNEQLQKDLIEITNTKAKITEIKKKQDDIKKTYCDSSRYDINKWLLSISEK